MKKNGTDGGAAGAGGKLSAANKDALHGKQNGSDSSSEEDVDAEELRLLLKSEKSLGSAREERNLLENLDKKGITQMELFQKTLTTLHKLPPRRTHFNLTSCFCLLLLISLEVQEEEKA